MLYKGTLFVRTEVRNNMSIIPSVNSPFHYSMIPWVDNFSENAACGRVIMGKECNCGSRLDFHNCAGSKLPAYLIYHIIEKAFHAGWSNKLEQLHCSRKDWWKLHVYLNPEGAKEYRLYTIKQNKAACSSAITITGGQIDTFSIWLQDAAPLLEKIIKDYPPVLLRIYKPSYCFPYWNWHVVNQSFLEIPEPILRQREETEKITAGVDIQRASFSRAGETSGLIETIEALKCLEVLFN